MFRKYKKETHFTHRLPKKHDIRLHEPFASFFLADRHLARHDSLLHLPVVQLRVARRAMLRVEMPVCLDESPRRDSRETLQVVDVLRPAGVQYLPLLEEADEGVCECGAVGAAGELGYDLIDLRNALGISC